MIRVEITDYNFEHDLYALVRSFYPGAETKVEQIPHLREYPPYAVIHLGAEETKGEEDFLSVFFPDAEDMERAGATRIDLKSYIKREIYKRLAEFTGKELPWGTLTGIRPAKLATRMLEEGRSDDEILARFEDEFLCGDEQARLCLNVAKNEKAILGGLDYEKGYSLYVGIPFCPTRCLYCSFTSYPLEKWAPRVDEYLDALCFEIDFVAEKMRERPLQTIYMGGGTPTTLSAGQMDLLLSRLEEAFGFSLSSPGGKTDEGPVEFTVEAGRPDSITEEKLEVLRRHGIGRISINPQTMQQKTLDLIGRKHTVRDIENTFRLAREMGFDNINMDLIMGLPDETEEDVRGTLERIRELSPDSLTVHSLAVKRAARLNTMRETYSRYRVENTQEMIDLSRRTAAQMGLLPYYLYRQKNMAGNYENVGYAKVDKACIYNILIMEEKQSIVALGAGGSTKIRDPETDEIRRIENVKDVGNYIERISEMCERKAPFLG